MYFWAHAYVHAASKAMWHKFNLVCNHMGFSLCRFESACSTKTPWRGRGRLSVQVNGDEHISETHLSGRHMNPLSDSEACTFHLVQLREQPSIMLVGMWLEVWWSAIFTRTIIHLPLTAVADKQLQREKHNPVSSKKGMMKTFSVDSFYFVSHYLLLSEKQKSFPKSSLHSSQWPAGGNFKSLWDNYHTSHLIYYLSKYLPNEFMV